MLIILCTPLLLLPLSFFEESLPLHLLSTLGCYFTHPPKHFSVVRGWFGVSDASLPTGLDRSRIALWGTNLDCMVANPVGQCYCMPETLATCGQALSCCQISCFCTKGTRMWQRISSLYLTAVILPSTTINCDFTPCAKPVLTIIEPPQTYPVHQCVGKAFPATLV